MSLKKFTRSAGRAGASWASNKIGGAIGKINDPLLRGAAGGLLQQVLPGFGGGSADFRDTSFNTLIRNRLIQAQSELAEIDQPLNLSDEDGVQKKYDWRARLRPKDGGADTFYQSSDEDDQDVLMRPLRESNGLIWQYTPTVYVQTMAEYNNPHGQGQNYQHYTFNKRSVQSISVTGDFTANDIYEGRYLLGVMAFLRASTMAYYGEQAKEKAGTPPPVLLFEYLGDHGFNKVPVVVDTYNLQLPDNVDYVPIEIAGKITYVPTEINIQVTLRPSYTPEKLRKKFNLDDISSGDSYKDGFI